MTMTAKEIETHLDEVLQSTSFRYRKILIHQDGSEFRARLSVRDPLSPVGRPSRLWRYAKVYSLESIKRWVDAYLDADWRKGETFP